jgi:ketosteroid isomerase-like protein
MPEENIEAARCAVAAFNEAGVEGLLVHLDPGIEWISVRGFLPDAQDRAGHEGVREWFSMISELFCDLRWEPFEFVDAGDQVMVSARLGGTGKGSGIATEITLFHVITLRGSKAVRFESYVNRPEALEAAGLSE